MSTTPIQDQYFTVPLVRQETGRALLRIVEAGDGMMRDYPDTMTPQQAETVGWLLDYLVEYADLDDLLDMSQRMKEDAEVSQKLEELKNLGLGVFAGGYRGKHEHENGNVSRLGITIILVAPTDDPRIMRGADGSEFIQGAIPRKEKPGKPEHKPARGRAAVNDSDLHRQNPNQIFLRWCELRERAASSENMNTEDKEQLENEVTVLQKWLEGLGHWRRLKPDAKELSSTAPDIQEKHKKAVEEFMTKRRAVLRVIEYDEVKTAHKCEYEGTEHERAQYHWTYSLAGDPRLILSLEPGNLHPQHHTPENRRDFKTLTPCGYTILESKMEIGGTVFFPWDKYIAFDPWFNGRVEPAELFAAGDYELRRVKTGTPLDVINADLRQVRQNTDSLPAKLGQLQTGITEVSQNTEAIAKNEYVLREKNAEMQRLHAEGYLKFVAKLNAKDFEAFAAIMILGTRKKAADALNIPHRSFYDLVKRWPGMGPVYKHMSRLVEWRKKVGRKIMVRLGDSLLSGEPNDRAENPQTNQEVLAKIKSGGIDSRNYPDILRQILEAMIRQNANNREIVQKEVIELIREELPQ